MKTKEEEEEKRPFKDFTDGSSGGRGYKNKIVFLRKSKKGEHLYAFDNEGAFVDAKEGSIVMNVSDVKNLIEGKFDYIKISIMPKREENKDGTKNR